MKIALQTFTIRKEANKNLETALEKAVDIGYTAIEYAYIPFDNSHLAILKKLQDKYGLEIIALQVQFDVLKEDSKKIINFALEVGAKAIDFAAMPKKVRKYDKNSIISFCEDVNENSKIYLDKGLRYNYHHHDFEFADIDGYRQFDTIAEKLNNDIGFTIDTYWATKAGLYVPHLIEKLAPRVYGLHLRDYAQVTKWDTSREGKDFAVGKGLVEFDKVFASALAAGVAYGAVEQNTKNPFEELKFSYDYISKHKIEGIEL